MNNQQKAFKHKSLREAAIRSGNKFAGGMVPDPHSAEAMYERQRAYNQSLADRGMLAPAQAATAFEDGTPFVEAPDGVPKKGDKVPSMLTHGEAVLPVKTVQAVGEENIARLIEQTNGRPPKRSLHDGAGYASGMVDIEKVTRLPKNGLDLGTPSGQPSGSMPRPAPKPSAIPTMGADDVAKANSRLAAARTADAAEFAASRGAPVAKDTSLFGRAKSAWSGARGAAANTASAAGGSLLKGVSKKAGLGFALAMPESIALANEMSKDTYGKGIVGAAADAIHDIGQGGVWNNAKLAVKEAFGMNDVGDPKMDNYSWKDATRKSVQAGQPKLTPAEAPALAQPAPAQPVPNQPATVQPQLPKLASAARMLNDPSTPIPSGTGAFRRSGGQAVQIDTRPAPAPAQQGQGNTAADDAMQARQNLNTAYKSGNLDSIAAAKHELRAAIEMRGQDSARVGHELTNDAAQARLNRDLMNDNEARATQLLKDIYQDADKDGKPIIGGESYKNARRMMSAAIGTSGRDLRHVDPSFLNEFMNRADVKQAVDDKNGEVLTQLWHTITGEKVGKSQNPFRYQATGENNGVFSDDTRFGVGGRQSNTDVVSGGGAILQDPVNVDANEMRVSDLQRARRN